MEHLEKIIKNIEELKKERENIQFTPDPAELRRQEMIRLAEIQYEEDRIRRLKSHDEIAGQHYSKVHTKLLGFNPDLERQLTYNN